MKNPKIQLALGLLLSLLFLALALRGVDAASLWQSVLHFNWLYAVPFVALTLFSMWIRAWRWHYFIRPITNIRTGRLFGPMMAGFAINGLLPARIGEFARAYILARQEQQPFLRLFATIVVERIFDTLTLLLLLAITFANLKFDPNLKYPYSTEGHVTSLLLTLICAGIGSAVAITGLYLWRKFRGADRTASRLPRTVIGTGTVLFLMSPLFMLLLPETIHYGRQYEISGESLKALSGKVAVMCVILLVGTILLLWPLARNLVQQCAERLPYAPRSIRMKISALICSFAEGLASLKSWKVVLLVIVQSLVVWYLVAWTMQMLPYGIAGMRPITLNEATCILVITCLAILIPAAPGYWGLMELGIKFGVVLLGVDSDPSRIMAYALITHALQYFPITGIGIYYLARSRISLSEIRDSTQTTDPVT